MSPLPEIDVAIDSFLPFRTAAKTANESATTNTANRCSPLMPKYMFIDVTRFIGTTGSRRLLTTSFYSPVPTDTSVVDALSADTTLSTYILNIGFIQPSTLEIGLAALEERVHRLALFVGPEHPPHIADTRFHPTFETDGPIAA